MSENIAVIYEGGLLRPLQPLNLPEHTQLEIKIVAPLPNDISDKKKAYLALLRVGIIQPSSPLTVEPISEEILIKSAQAMGKSGSLSELILRERDEE